MAKNKKQNRKQPQTGRGQQAAEQISMESSAEQDVQQVTPGHMARKGRQKSFGHN
ncbi:hypothetical protein [Streptomyces sp. SLBN-31]|uniref:hypothetical protein n=1 Tax=unclassified Streptomyces TaxID=2593676 RepID=UPI00116EF32E|nr:hypothetical protein [Streptomyces sp. SLBN-31]TQJ87474.1 hypothetical protein FBY22_6316 [Streptomyces sp. SLBN-31]